MKLRKIPDPTFDEVVRVALLRYRIHLNEIRDVNGIDEYAQRNINIMVALADIAIAKHEKKIARRNDRQADLLGQITRSI
jgi:hypothetical protein